MSLSKSTFDYLGQLLQANPVYGWGWSRIDEGAPPSASKADQPAQFRMRIISFFEHEGKLRGATARVEEPGHVYNEWFVVFSTRHQGEFDFEANIPQCNISIGPEVKEGAWPQVKGAGAIAGFAEVKKVDKPKESGGN